MKTKNFMGDEAKKEEETPKRKRKRQQSTKIVRDETPQEGSKPVKADNINRRLHRVLIKGNERWLTESAILVASRDKKLKLQIPEDSTFQQVSKVKTCKDC